MTIREAIPSDARAIWELNEAFNGAGANDAACVRRALENPSGELILVADAGGALAGFACGRVLSSVCYPEKTAEVTELYVAREYRRAGVAAALVREMESIFRAAGAGEFHLYTGLRNEAAQAFYEKMGYESSHEILYTKTP